MSLHRRAFTHRDFYTKIRLHTEAFTQRSLLGREIFTQRSFHTETSLHRGDFTHRCFYTKKRLHTEAFTHRRLYTKKLLHEQTCTQRSFYRVQVPPGNFFQICRGFFFRHSALPQKTPPTCRRLRKTFRAGTCSRLSLFWENLPMHVPDLRFIQGLIIFHFQCVWCLFRVGLRLVWTRFGFWCSFLLVWGAIWGWFKVCLNQVWFPVFFLVGFGGYLGLV